MAAIPERFIWATRLLNIKPHHNILEIGCGVGLWAEQIAGKLTKGQLTAIDRSAPMIAKAKKRNMKFIEKGISAFYVSEFVSYQPHVSHYDSIAAFNVNFFWRDPFRELEIISNQLNENGKLFIFYQPPFDIDIDAAEPIVKILKENSFIF